MYKTVVFSKAVRNCTKGLLLSRQICVSTEILMSGFVAYLRQIMARYESQDRVSIPSFPLT